MAKERTGTRAVAQNRKAYHDYSVLEKYEAGVSLAGTEVKSVRAGNVNLKDSWCEVRDGELMLRNVHISPYEKGNIFNREPRRDRRLLMHRREIIRLYSKVRQEGLTLVPLSMYFKNGYIKVEIGLCKGKKIYDKRESEARRDAERSIQRTMKES